MGVLEELEQAAAVVLEAAAGAVVRIGAGWGRGNGIVLAAGQVLTNAHNLRGDQTTVTFADGRSLTAEVTGIDVDGDLAVLSVDTGSAAALAWSAPDKGVRAGTPVFALALLPGEGTRLSFGTVSAVGRSFRGPGGRLVSDAFEHTAPLGRGSSGGPVVDSAGALVGISTHRLGEGFYLAVSAGAPLKERVDRLSQGQSPRRLRLGVALAPPAAARRLRAAVGLPERDGLLVRGVEADSPAAQAGIARGDLLIEAGGRALASPDDLFAVLESASGTFAVKLLRGAEELEVQVSLTAS
jgi:serine protease Do